ncbi:MAG: hypothetical protein HY422_01190, partial [Candidatus Komeilibacteria bacterium]|nr:hypothetical protein [Candidatus Komeilibacteria bacterium]
MMRRMRLFFRKKTIVVTAMAAGLIGAVLFALPIPVYAIDPLASLSDFFKTILFGIITYTVGNLMNFLLYILVEVSQYNGFADAPIVERGWTVLRDLSNMFFVLILLIIAISSIVKWQVVNYRQNLRRLIMMAILINFSKTIVVFMIDLSQVITLTFISAVKDVLQAGVVTALGLDAMVSPLSSGGVGTFAGDLFTYVVAALAFCVATLVVGLILIIFLARIIALWLVIVFAPLAFLASTLPQTKEWYDRWWKILGANLTVAPVLAFMLWLVFAVIANQGQILISASVNGASGNEAPVASATVGGIASSSLIGFLVAIGLLMYSIRLAVQMGAAGSKVAQNFANKAQGYATTAAKRLGVGKSGRGGALGLARSAASRAVSRPLDTLGAVSGATIGRLTGGLAAGAQAVGLRPVAARIRDFRERTAEGYGRMAEGARKGWEGIEAAPVRFLRGMQRRAAVPERGAQQKRAAAEAEAMGVSRMTYSERKDVLASASPFFNARKAAVARAMFNEGQVDDLKKEGPEGEKLVKQALGHVNEDLGLTTDEQQKFMANNFRFSNLKSKETEELIKTMHTEGKPFARKDQLDPVAGALIARLGHETLTGPEFKKYIDRIPKEAQKYAAKGLEERMEKLVMPGRETFAKGDEGQRVYAKQSRQVGSDREDIRQALVKLNPNDVEVYSHDLILKDGKVVFDGVEVDDEGKKVATRDLNPQEAETRQRMIKSLGVKQIAAMKPDTLRNNGNMMDAGDIIKSGTH